MNHQDDRPRVKVAFERETVIVAVGSLVPLKTLRPGTKDGKKYSQIVRSIRAIGLVEPPVVTPDPTVQTTISFSTVSYVSKPLRTSASQRSSVSSQRTTRRIHITKGSIGLCRCKSTE
jgi:hypothetical protein